MKTDAMGVTGVRRLVVLAGTATSILYFGLWGMDYAMARWIQAYFGYYFCLSVVTMASVTIWQRRRDIGAVLHSGSRKQWAAAGPVLVAVGASYLLLLHEPFVLRVFDDEARHLSTALVMAENRGTYGAGVGYYELGGYSYGKMDPVYRMYLYPFAVSLLNNLTGYRIENGFLINGAATMLIFLLVSYLGRAFGGGNAAGYCAQALLLTSPLLQQVVNSGAYDPLNLAMLAAYALACLFYAARPGTVDGMNLCLSVGLCLSYARSESVLFLVVFMVLFVGKCVRTKSIEITWFAAFSPLLLIGPFAGRIIAEEFAKSFTSRYGSDVEGFFAVKYFLPNGEALLGWLFSTDDAALNSLILTVLFVTLVPTALALYVHRLRRRQSGRSGLGKRLGEQPDHFGAESPDPGGGWRGNSASSIILVLFLAVICVHVMIILTHFWTPIEASAVRFFLPLTLFTALAVVWAGGVLSDPISRFQGGVVHWVLTGLALLFFWGVTLPKGARAETTYRNANVALARYAMEWVAAHDDGKTLYAVSMVDYFILHRLPAIGLENFKRNYARIDGLVAEGIYDRVIVFDLENLNPQTVNWENQISRISERPEIQYEVLDVRRGFIHLEQRVLRVSGWKDSPGEVIPLGQMSVAPSGETDRAYFERLRVLRSDSQGRGSE